MKDHWGYSKKGTHNNRWSRKSIKNIKYRKFMKEELAFKERRSNNTINDFNKQKLLDHVEKKLLKKVKELIGKLRIITLYEYDDIDINIKHKIKL